MQPKGLRRPKPPAGGGLLIVVLRRLRPALCTTITMSINYAPEATVNIRDKLQLHRSRAGRTSASLKSRYSRALRKLRPEITASAPYWYKTLYRNDPRFQRGRSLCPTAAHCRTFPATPTQQQSAVTRNTPQQPAATRSNPQQPAAPRSTIAATRCHPSPSAQRA